MCIPYVHSHAHSACKVNTKHSPIFAQDGDTPLLLAAWGGHVEVVRMLLNEFSSLLDEVDNVSVLQHTVSTKW